MWGVGLSVTVQGTFDAQMDAKQWHLMRNGTGFWGLLGKAAGGQRGRWRCVHGGILARAFVGIKGTVRIRILRIWGLPGLGWSAQSPHCGVTRRMRSMSLSPALQGCMGTVHVSAPSVLGGVRHVQGQGDGAVQGYEVEGVACDVLGQGGGDPAGLP